MTQQPDDDDDIQYEKWIRKARIARLAYLQLDELRQIVHEIKHTSTPLFQTRRKSHHKRSSISYKALEVRDIVQNSMCPHHDDEEVYFDYIYCDKYGTDCYIFSAVDTITIAWRGTEATNEDGYSLQDMIQDLKFHQTKCSFLSDSECLVHSGFLQQYNAVRLRVHQCIEKRLDRFEPEILEDITVECIGHSLGGALAVFCALDITVNCGLLKQIGNEVHCTTFGSPKIGNKAFAAKFRRYVHQSNQLIFKRDIIPKLPPFKWYKDVGEIVTLKQPRNKTHLSPTEIHHYSHYLEGAEDLPLRNKYSSVKGLKKTLELSLSIPRPLDRSLAFDEGSLHSSCECIAEVKIDSTIQECALSDVLINDVSNNNDENDNEIDSSTTSRKSPSCGSRKRCFLL